MAGRAVVHVVDDEPPIRRSLQWLVESIGFAVQLHSSAQSFLDRYDPGVPGCVLLDIRMPGMSGLDLQDRLRELGYTIPVIIVTGYGDVPMAVRAMKAGAVDFIEKPVRDQILLDQIQRAVAQDQQEHDRRARFADVLERMATLTAREREVLRLVIGGKPAREIAEALQVRQKTVESHRANIMRKMEARSIPHLVQMYLQASSVRQENTTSLA